LSGHDETCREPIAGMIDEIASFDGRWCDRMRELHRRCALEFGKQHGWRLQQGWIHPLALVGGKESQGWTTELHRVFDHPECYRMNRAFVAIVAHTYAPREHVERYVAGLGLPMRWLARSWYAPGMANAFVVTAPE
jgi:hypothetical protein